MAANELPGGRLDILRRKAQLAFAAVATAAVLVWLAGHVVDVLLLGFAGLLLGLSLSGAGAWLAERTPVPRKLGTAITVVVLAGAATMIGWLTAPEISKQIDDLVRSLPKAVEHVTGDLSHRAWGQALLDRLGDPGALLRRQDVLARATGLFSSTFGVLGAVVLVVFVGLFVAFEPSAYREGLIRLVPPARRPRAQEVLDALAHTLRRWVAGKLLSMAVIGLLTWIGLQAIGLEPALSLALLAAVFTFVPYVGPVLSAIPAVLLALLQGASTAGWAIALYTAIQIVESYMITPLIQRRAVSLPPGVILIAQALLGAIGGAIGIVVATPLAAAALVLVESLYIEDVLGDRPGS
jgi:predicted PurR-regulated permease PerM